MQILWQIHHARLYLVVDGMAFPVGRFAHGDERQVKPGSLQSEQFLGDKGF